MYSVHLCPCLIIERSPGNGGFGVVSGLKALPIYLSVEGCLHGGF